MTDYAKRFAAANKKAAEPRNDHYTPYQVGSDWHYDDAQGRRSYGFISEELCASAAQRRQERDEE